MIIYNVTLTADWSIHDAWLRWVKEEFIPGILNSNLFQKHQLVRLLEVDETYGPTYAIQFYANSMDDYKRYYTELSGELNKKNYDKWGDKSLAFETIMQVVH